MLLKIIGKQTMAAIYLFTTYGKGEDDNSENVENVAAEMTKCDFVAIATHKKNSLQFLWIIAAASL